MMLKENHEIKVIVRRLEEGMVDFIEPGETSYTKDDVEKCMVILRDYLSEMDETAEKEKAMIIVEKTVLALNELNENCEFELIETGQREDIAEVIILAGNLKGYNSRDEDITEEWRDW